MSNKPQVTCSEESKIKNIAFLEKLLHSVQNGEVLGLHVVAFTTFPSGESTLDAYTEVPHRLGDIMLGSMTRSAQRQGADINAANDSQ